MMFSDTTIKSIESVLIILASLGGIFASIGYGYGKIWGGISKEKKDDQESQINTIALLNDRMGVYEKQVAEYKKQVAQLSEQITKLETSIKEKDKNIEQYLALLANRDPKTEKFIDFMTRIGNEAEEYMKESTKALTNIRLDIRAITPVPK